MTRKASLIGGIVAALAIAATPAAARPGDVIVGDSNDSTVIRVDATGATSVVSDDPRLARPNDVVFGRDGTIYVADYGLGGEEPAVFSINPKTGATDVVSDDPRFGTPDGIAMGPDGNLYVTDLDVLDGVGLFRVELPSGTTTALSDDPLLGGGPIGVVVPPNGSPLVGISDLIARVNPLTGSASVVADAGDGLEGGEGLTRGPDGTLYFAEETAGLQAVDPDTGEVTDLSGPIPYDGYGLSFDFHGRVVFGNGGPELYAADIRNGSFEAIATGFGYPEGSEVEPPKCKGKTATIVGSTKKDKIKGSKFNDVIVGIKGNDRINGGKGNDLICGGKGKDKLKGGKGKDKLFGQAGKDKLNGGPGKDVERQ